MASRAAKRRIEQLPATTAPRPLKRVHYAPRRRGSVAVPVPKAIATPVAPNSPTSLFTFTFDLHGTLMPQEDQPSSPPEHPTPCLAPIERLEPADNRAIAPLKGKTRTKSHGQNAFMTDWKNNAADEYLDRLFSAEHLSEDASRCELCSEPSETLYRCRDCMHTATCCITCLKHNHRLLPTHRFRRWTGTFFQDISSLELGYVFHLGHSGEPCSLGTEKNVIIGDITGISSVRIRFCKHPKAGDHPRQLLAAQIYPCSDRVPETGFTFACLKQFSLLAGDAKLSAQGYYNVLVSQTSAIFPEQVPDRYREFLRVSRQWQHLADAKRFGATSASSNITISGDLALRCPACPRPGFNCDPEHAPDDQKYLYTQHVSYDGNFQLTRKRKPVDKDDICLSEGRKYFVHNQEFQNYLEGIQDSANVAANAKNENCNNHRALGSSWVRYEGLAETGVGSTICARHSFFMPTGTVNYKRGERYAYTDFAITAVISRCLQEGLNRIGVHYDIMCHYQTHMWVRWGRLPNPIVLERFVQAILAVPKFHMAGHTDNCYARFCLNNITGVGRLDGEGGERCWANLNQAARSSSEKGPGSRMDGLNHVMSQWNWSKTVRMVSHIIAKHDEASRMALEQREAWLQLDSNIDHSLTSQWSTMSTEPTLVGGQWSSVFVLKEPSAATMANQLKALVEEEQLDSVLAQQGQLPGSAMWIASGIEIRVLQKRLADDAKAYGPSPTPRQAADLNGRRQTLSERIKRHQQDALKFVPEVHIPSASPGKSSDTPETYTILLPSMLPHASPTSSAVDALRDSELRLQRAYCFKALQTIRAYSISYAQVIQGKRSHKRSVANTTRSEAMLGRLSAKQQHAIWAYNLARGCIQKLSTDDADHATFQEFSATQLKELNLTVLSRPQTGDGFVRLPWYWRVGMVTSGESSTFTTRSNSALREEHVDGE